MFVDKYPPPIGLSTEFRRHLVQLLAQQRIVFWPISPIVQFYTPIRSKLDVNNGESISFSLICGYVVFIGE